MQVDVEDVRREYDEYRKELSAFLGSPQIYAKADKFLTGDRYLYIFMCFFISKSGLTKHPTEGRATCFPFYRAMQTQVSYY